MNKRINKIVTTDKLKGLILIVVMLLFGGCASYEHVQNHKHVYWRWPAQGNIVRTFGNNNGKNKGIDIQAKSGANIYAASSGRVVYCGQSLHSYGRLIIIKHLHNMVSVYSHVRDVQVKEKDTVIAGQKIAKLSKPTKSKSRAILHFEIRKNGIPVDPLLFIEIGTKT